MANNTMGNNQNQRQGDRQNQGNQGNQETRREARGGNQGTQGTQQAGRRDSEMDNRQQQGQGRSNRSLDTD